MALIYSWGGWRGLCALLHSTVPSGRTRPWCPPARHLSASTEKPTEEKRATACSTSASRQSHRGSTSSRKVPSAPRLPVPPAPRRWVSAAPTLTSSARLSCTSVKNRPHTRVMTSWCIVPACRCFSFCVDYWRRWSDLHSVWTSSSHVTFPRSCDHWLLWHTSLFFYTFLLSNVKKWGKWIKTAAFWHQWTSDELNRVNSVQSKLSLIDGCKCPGWKYFLSTFMRWSVISRLFEALCF